jgi:hypothetical protein
MAIERFALPFTAVGTSDEVLTCDCCGRADLQMTVALRDADGEILYFGRNCAAKATGWRVAQLDKNVTAANNARGQAADIAARWGRYVAADGSVDVAWFRANNAVALQRFPSTDAEIAAQIRQVITDNTNAPLRRAS